MLMPILPCPMCLRTLFLFSGIAFECSGKLHPPPPGYSSCKHVRDSQVLYTNDGQPFLVAGSGTLGWDMV